MPCYLDFELDGEVTRFEVVGADPATFWPLIGDENGPFFAYIEEVEWGEGPRCGTIDQTGEGENIWTIGSSEIEDKAGFIEQTKAKVEALFGWTLRSLDSSLIIE